jgi:hypothetical protein
MLSDHLLEFKDSLCIRRWWNAKPQAAEIWHKKFFPAGPVGSQDCLAGGEMPDGRPG